VFGRWSSAGRTTYVKNSFNSRRALYPAAPSQIPSFIAMRRALGFILDPQFGVIFGGTCDKGEIPRLVAATLFLNMVYDSLMVGGFSVPSVHSTDLTQWPNLF
jgi:hypothetical protein